LELLSDRMDFSQRAGLDRPQASDVRAEVEGRAKRAADDAKKASDDAADDEAIAWAQFERETYRWALASMLQLVADIGWPPHRVEPLRNLFFALEALDQGTPHPAFKPATKRGRPPLPDQAQRKRAAAAAALIAFTRAEAIKGGAEGADQRAQTIITRHLRDAPPHIFNVSAPVTGADVEEWRAKLSKHAATYKAGQENFGVYVKMIDHVDGSALELERFAHAAINVVR